MRMRTVQDYSTVQYSTTYAVHVQYRVLDERLSENNLWRERTEPTMSKEMSDMAGSPPPYSQPTYPSNPRPPPPSGYYETPPPHMQQPPMTAYAPAPPVFQQQQSNNNVVVVGQQPTVTREVHHVPSPYASSYMVLTGVMMVLCFLHGNLPAFICLVPALICSCAAVDHNSSGEYASAKECGSYSLCCNIFTIVYYILGLVGGVVVLIVYFTVGFATIGSAIHHATDDIVPTQCTTICIWNNNCYCDY